MILPSNLLEYKKDGFLFFKNKKDAEKDELIIETSKIDSIASYMLKNKLNRISVNSSYFPVNSMEFLKHIPFIQSISIVDNNLDVTPINGLNELHEIRIGGFKGLIDLKNFPKLEILNVEWSNKLKNIENAESLKWLWLDNYKNRSLDELSDLHNLSYLYLHKTSIQSLDGIGSMHSLTELNIDTASTLKSLDGLDSGNLSMKTLDIYQARNLNNYHNLKYLVNLEKLRFTKTGDIENIDFLNLLPNLKSIILGIKVIDGNMLSIQNIPEYKFLNFPHYNLKST